MANSKILSLIFAVTLGLFFQTAFAYSNNNEVYEQEQGLEKSKKSHRMMGRAGIREKIAKRHARRGTNEPAISDDKPEPKPRKPYMMTR